MQEVTSQPDLNFFVSLLPLAVIIFAISIGVILLQAHFRKNLFLQLLKQRETETSHQKELLRATVETQEAERKRIAQDLHDELGAMLSIARMQLVQLERQKTLIEPGALQNVRLTTESALAAMRRLSHELMPPQLEILGVIKTLEDICDTINMTGDIQISFDASPAIPRWTTEIELAIFRISMELVNNTIKHAGAKKASMHVSQEKEWILIRYMDDGKGIDADAASLGLGLRSIEARINSLGGIFHIANGRDCGIDALFKIPLKTQSI